MGCNFSSVEVPATTTAVATPALTKKSTTGTSGSSQPQQPPSPSSSSARDRPQPETAPAHEGTTTTPGRRGTWRRFVSMFSWPQLSVLSEKRETVDTILESEDRARRDISPEGSRSDTVRDEEGQEDPELEITIHPGSTTSSMHNPPVTVPCQYRTGKTLGSGTYAIVKEAVHIKTNKFYACKVINKKLMEGREYMVRNEISVLKRISSGHCNIVTLHDYFETSHNLYLVFDLCTGGELFDRICAKGNYYEADAAELVRTIFKAVQYIHDADIVHRDLKPENLLFRTEAEEADIMVADFGLSRVMDTDKLNKLTEICGTPGYMAPEIFKKTGHGKPVDVWAMGVITYFLLAGYTPFDRDTQQQEMEAIMAGDYAFKPEEYWANVSDTARQFVTMCLTIDPAQRPTASEALKHKWLSDPKPHFVPDPGSPSGAPTDLLPHIQLHTHARKTFRKAVFGMMAVNRMTLLSHPHAQTFTENVLRYKEESEREKLENSDVVHHHNYNHGEPSSPDLAGLPSQLAKTSLGESQKPKTPS